jgi:hypothetical protein
MPGGHREIVATPCTCHLLSERVSKFVRKLRVDYVTVRDIIHDRFDGDLSPLKILPVARQVLHERKYEHRWLLDSDSSGRIGVEERME